MGGDAMFRVVQRTQASGLDRLVLLGLASFADGDGWCHPSIRKLARRAGVAKSTVQLALPRLVELGEVQMVERGHSQRDPVKDRHNRPGGFQATHYYRLSFGHTLAPAAASVAVSGVPLVGTPETVRCADGEHTQVCRNDAILGSGSLLLNKSVRTSHKDKSSGRGASAPVENSEARKERNDRPTDAQLDKLSNVCLDELLACGGSMGAIGELNEQVRRKAANLPGFDYRSDIDRLNRSIARVLLVRELQQQQGRQRR